jgi:hypothetical protein
MPVIGESFNEEYLGEREAESRKTNQPLNSTKKAANGKAENEEFCENLLHFFSLYVIFSAFSDAYLPLSSLTGV